MSQKLKYQIELLGHIVYTDPTMDKRIVAVTELDTTYSPKFKAYCLATGQSTELKVHKSRNPKDESVTVSFREEPFCDGDILYMKRPMKRPKFIKSEDGWIKSETETVWWLEDYRKMNM